MTWAELLTLPTTLIKFKLKEYILQAGHVPKFVPRSELCCTSGTLSSEVLINFSL